MPFTNIESSSNTWVGASKPYAKTETSVDTGDAVVCLPRLATLPAILSI